MRALRLTGLALVLAIGSFAAPITITYNSTGTGSVGGTPFTAATFTLTELLDTTNRVSFSGGFFIDDNSTSIAITGIGTFAFTTPTRSFVNNSVSGEGFSRAGVAGADLMQTATNVAFATWAARLYSTTGVPPLHSKLSQGFPSLPPSPWSA